MPHRSKVILQKSTERIAAKLGLTQVELDLLLGVTESTSEPDSERQVLFIRFYDAAIRLLGDDKAVLAWLDTYNKHVGAIPRVHLQSRAGLQSVVEYLEAHLFK